MAASDKCILLRVEGHKLESYGIFCFYDCRENSEKIFSVRTSPLTARQRFNMMLATEHQ